MIRYYWDEHTVAEIVALLREYADLFPLRFIDMKGMDSLA